MTEKPDNKSDDDKDKTGENESPFEGDAMDRFVTSFEASARRWELVIYPAMLAFVVLAAYGFFLIYTLSKDIHTLAQGMDPQMAKNLGNMSDSVVYLSENIRTMTRRVDKMTHYIEDISGKMDALENLDPMLVNMRSMNLAISGMDQSIRVMTANTDAMRYEMGKMGYNTRSMGKMNDFMPW